MKFETLDEFLSYFYKNNLVLGDINFDIPEAPADEVDPSVTPDVIEEPPADMPEEEIREPLVEWTTLMLASGNLDVKFDRDGFILVEEWAMTPNACGTGSLVIEGRQLHLNMCDMDGTTVAYFHTSSGLNQPMKIRLKN